MNKHQVRDLCLSLPGATEQIQWGNDLLFKVGGKMFVCMGADSGVGYSFKCSEETFYELTEMAGIRPARYLARAHWIDLDPTVCRLRPGEVERLVRQSYELVVSRLPKKTQEAIRKAPKERRRSRSQRDAAEV
jgi:predicted DNA-binding protein (MmcQ/YjbR family)